MTNVLVTGATGYLGSHACVQLLASGHRVVGIDNFENSSRAVVDRIDELALAGGVAGGLDFHEIDLRNESLVAEILSSREIDAVIHFAGLKSVGESMGDPLRYYETNLTTTLALLGCMNAAAVTKLVFSSSCTVYGNPSVDDVPITESASLGAVSPYGRTKLMIEQMLADVAAADPRWSVVSLRYFNPVGAHESGAIGDDAKRGPSSLLPIITETAIGRRERVLVFGDDYDTPDGTCIRDYIHVDDLVSAHIETLAVLDEVDGSESINLGTGHGWSVLEMIGTAERVTGRSIPYEIVDRRPGDAAAVHADPARALARLGWKAEHDLERMTIDAWRWQQMNPDGYPGP